MQIAQQMTAAVSEQYGAPETIVLQQVPVPACKDEDVLVKVAFAAVSRTDSAILRAEPFIVRFFTGLLKPKSSVLGCEFAGEVVALGSAVTNVSIGDRIIAWKDEDYGFGAHAQYATMNVNGLMATIPAKLSYEEAAASLEGGHYALSSIQAAKLSNKHRVLVNGATGAIGSAALQILVAEGIEVTAVCAGAQMDTVKALGATKVIDFQTSDFTQLDEKFDMVFDAVGKSTFGTCKRILNENGCYQSTELGPMAQNPFLALWTRFFGKQKVLFPMPTNKKADGEYLASLMEKNQFRPLIDRTFPLSEIVDAYHYVESGEKIGNVLVKMD